jgi:thioesterase domain-containing protein
MVAHRLAGHLERLGAAPAAVVLLDTYSPDRGEMSFRFWSELPRVVLENSASADDGLADAWLTAVTHYFSLDWKDPGETSVPTLLVRATERVRWVTDEDWMTSWEFSSQLTTVDVPGDHFTMMGEHADSTAAAVNEWLAKIADPIAGSEA